MVLHSISLVLIPSVCYSSPDSSGPTIGPAGNIYNIYAYEIQFPLTPAEAPKTQEIFDVPQNPRNLFDRMLIYIYIYISMHYMLYVIHYTLYVIYYILYIIDNVYILYIMYMLHIICGKSYIRCHVLHIMYYMFYIT